MSKKTLAVVDVQSLFLSSRAEFGPFARVDYVKLKDLCRYDKEELIDFVAYPIKSPYHDDTKFIRFLKNQGYSVIRKASKVEKTTYFDGSEKEEFKNSSWTSFMVWETLQLLPRYDRIVIVSGSGPFCTIVGEANRTLKPVTVVSFTSSLHKELANLASNVIILNKNCLYDVNEVNKGK